MKTPFTFSITEHAIDWISNKQWEFLFFILLLVDYIGRCVESGHVAWKSEEYEVGEYEPYEVDHSINLTCV